MKIDKFEDIKAWHEARELTKSIYALTSKGNFDKDFRLKDQIRSAAASIMANIAEGFDAQSDLEFIKFLIYSRRSASEVQSHLYVALDQAYLSEEYFRKLSDDIVKIKNLIYGFIRYLQKTNKGGKTSSLGLRT
ncbi:MAG: four helix bundle protein [Candidatus Margulisbacteria bacterium]|nr:four helix bundle protein [Candidatus Margulisiibacteriota bacterium]MBU1617516.1 four helix bundle protein [Candidatus Margulisiibacteriota bacterium]